MFTSRSPSVAPIFAPAHSLIVVLPGDSWFSICSREYGNSSVWSRIAEFNGMPQNLPLTVGMQLRLPVINPNGALSISSAPAMFAPGQGFAGGFPQGQPQGFARQPAPRLRPRWHAPRCSVRPARQPAARERLRPTRPEFRRSPRFRPAARPDRPAARSAPRWSVRSARVVCPKVVSPASSSLRRTVCHKPVSSLLKATCPKAVSSVVSPLLPKAR